MGSEMCIRDRLSWDRETLTGVLPITVGSVLSVLLGEVLIAARRPQH